MLVRSPMLLLNVMTVGACLHRYALRKGVIRNIIEFFSAGIVIFMKRRHSFFIWQRKREGGNYYFTKGHASLRSNTEVVYDKLA